MLAVVPFGQAAEELFGRIDRAPWFGRLGMAVTYDDFVAVVDSADFQSYAKYAAARALDIPVKNKSSIPDLVPLASGARDPAPGLSAALARLESEPRVFEPLKHVRLAVHRRVGRIELEVPRSPWLCFGELDLRPEAVRTAAEAARWAVTEQYLHRSGFWTRVFELFLAGNYPYGTAGDGRLYVL
jgi:hypothetical protein